MKALPDCPNCAAKDRIRDVRAWASSRKRHIEEDDRFKDEKATLQVNAPLALIQFAMETEHRCLTAVLKGLAGKWSEGK